MLPVAPDPVDPQLWAPTRGSDPVAGLWVLGGPGGCSPQRAFVWLRRVPPGPFVPSLCCSPGDGGDGAEGGGE